MQIVITMAGLGTRFRKAGYDVPKYEITAHGRTLFAWSMESLRGYFAPDNDWFFIVRREDDAQEFIMKEWEEFHDAGTATVIEIDYMTDGQATTALIASEYWKSDEPLMIYNIDTYVEAGCLKAEDIEGDGFIPCFNAPGDHWSFVKTDEAGDAVEVREKERISDNCTLGAYYFRTCRLYEEMYESYYRDPKMVEKGEKYVAPLYNHMIGMGMKVRICLVGAEHVHVLGTPEELDVFKNEDI
ncbi:MAG: glycosyltransferase family 2 protein [Lachnospiraceae bacterium]|nr:glycosyltransferase family 2 protein [Lachnospiraceae bacterium]